METVLMEVRDGEVVCSKCHGMVQCDGIVEVSFVSVEIEDGGLAHDWDGAGSASFIPKEYFCVDCGAILTDPGNLVNDEET